MADEKHALTTTVRPEEEGLMVKEILYGRLNLSRGLLRRMKRGGGVFLNGKRDFLSRRVRAGDRLKIVFFEEDTGLKPQNIPLDVVFEDDYLLIINKPAGMAVHPAGAYQENTLANAIAYYWKTIRLAGKVRLVHRLDKDTSGLIMVAKEPYTLQRLLRQLREGRLVREYLALAVGLVHPAAGMIAAPIGRSLTHGVKRAIDAQGREACTRYETLRGSPLGSLLRVRLESGRTHQIRVHLADLGHPLLGDPLYGAAVPGLIGQALHAWRLEFVHPRTGLRHEVTCPLPEKMFELWKSILKGDSPNQCLESTEK